MFTLKEMLDELKIRYSIRNKDGESTKFLCVIDKKDETRFPLRIILNKKMGVLGLYSGHAIFVANSDLNTVYPIINDLNREYALGTFYIDKKNRIQYYIGVSIEGEDSQLSISQLGDYINSIEIAHMELIYRLIKGNVISVSDKEEGNKSE